MIDAIKNKRLLQLADQYGTPLYAYDMDVIRERIVRLKAALPKELEVLYSMKANPNLGILSFIKSYVHGIEVASDGEMFAALQAGIPPDNIIFVGPGKTEDELEYAVDNGILSIVIESERELNVLEEIAKRQNKKVHVSIRINPLKELSGARIKMGGVAKQFGIDEERIGEIFGKAQSYTCVMVSGIHVYMGTQVLDADVLIQNFRNIFEIAKAIQHHYGIKLDFIDFGGGFGIPYFKGEKELDLQVLQDGLMEVFRENAECFDFKQMKLLVESGRFVVAESGYFLTRILYKKQSRNKTYLITDGGSNQHASAAGIGRFVRHNFPVAVLNKLNSEEFEKVDIVGPLCTPTDLLAQDIDLPAAQEGDVIVLLKSGAYGLSASMTGFLSHPLPAEVLFEDTHEYVIRQRGSREDFVAGQTLL